LCSFSLDLLYVSIPWNCIIPLLFFFGITIVSFLTFLVCFHLLLLYSVLKVRFRQLTITI